MNKHSLAILVRRMTVVLIVAASCEAVNQPSQPPHLSAVVEVGRYLFFDRSLSAGGEVACASCHRPERAYADGLVHASGGGGRQGTRNTPSIVDVGRQRSLFWDGRRTRLEDQALDPLFNEVEHALGSEADLLIRLHAAPYAAAFAEAFDGEGRTGDPITMPHVAAAIAAFERTLVSMPSAFDRFRAGELTAIPETARRGWIVFDQQVHCTRCHIATSSDELLPLFTDHAFHSLGVGLDKVERKLPELTKRLIALRRDGGPLGRDILLDRDLAELGRFAVTLDPRDLAAFKTPGLRNVARTAPYMHDGSVATLGEAVDLEVYSRGARDARPIILTPSERGDLIAFLEALTSELTR